ncbi:insulinase family protein [Aerophototrophica crusticola]|uniref:Insulinase family protein n=1 Tax=Aerophototrophica crusticola TaxID=1709002 RepID=A0A858R7I3_9PROT|nr:insulinase family protein [Rhodospirillaceae bacterium B3]
MSKGSAGIRVTTLPNGLRVATDFMPHVETVTVGVWIGVGSRHEPQDANGIAHLVEHMLFKGTPTRDAFRISAEIEDVGGHLNAYTGREHTTYYAKVLKQDLALALGVLADMVQHAKFDPEDLEKERQVIIQEIGQVEDTPDDIIYDHFVSAAFPGQMLGRPILGTAEVVGSTPRDGLVDYVRSRYVPANMVVSAAGHVDHDRLVELVTLLFTDLPAGDLRGAEQATYRGGDFREDRDLEQMHLVLGFNGVGSHDKDLYSASVLSTLLGGGMSSRLFQEVREKRGLVYSVHSFTWSMSDSGVFGIYAGTDPERAGELVPVICGEVAKLAGSLTEEEVARARAQMKASQLMGLESTTNRAEALGAQLLVYGRPIPTGEVIQRIDAVDLDAVRACADRLFGSTPTVAALGPLEALEPYEATVARLG